LEVKSSTRILIVQTAFLGDVVLTLPLVKAVRQWAPQARVEVLTTPANASVLEGQPGVDAVLTYDKRGRQSGLRGLVQMSRTIRAHAYDMVISPHRSLRSAWLVAVSGSEQRLGFRQWWTRWAYTATVPRPAHGHEVVRNHELVKLLDADMPAPGPFTLQVEAEKRREAAEVWARAGVRAIDVLVGLVPGSQWGTKRWPAEHFAALIDLISMWPDTHCALFGSPQERGIADAVAAASRAPVIDLVGTTSLRDLPAYMGRCDVVVSNDTGPMHIAAALGKPIVTLYGPTTPALGFTPYGVPWEEASVASLSCRPCHAHGPARCPLSHWQCMRALAPERVAAGVVRLLQSARTRVARGADA
jgi:heptosyltransferase-2